MSKKVIIIQNDTRVGTTGAYIFVLGLVMLFGCGFLTFCHLLSPDSWGYTISVITMVIGGSLFWRAI